MQENSIPKRKKELHCSVLKKTRSEETFHKQTKRKTQKKSLGSTLTTMASKSSILKSISPPSKSLKQSKKKKTKNPQPPKSSTKNQKQTRKARQSSSKTTKKTIKRIKSIQDKQQELTQRKKVYQEYFMYKDTYVPIENSEQRKVVFKIQLVDEKNQTKKISDRQTQMISAFTETQPQKVVDNATQITERRNYLEDHQCQTENNQEDQNTPVKLGGLEFQDNGEEEQKCFAETLSELQFLYLPDEKNFEGFSKLEKAHYKQLLICIAKKFQQPQPLPLDQETIEILLSQRQMKQRGIIQSYVKQGLPTHAPSVASYVSNLFCYIEIHQKIFLIDRVNCSYGFSMIEKFQRLRAGQSTKRPINLIPQSTFWKFEVDLHQGLDFQSQIVESSLHSHNKAIFDAVNQVLIEFQPYYSCQGEPFPWSQSLQTTFFCITDQSFGALVGQVKDKILQFSNTLAGVLLDVEGDLKYKTHIQKILNNQKNLLNSQNKKYSDKTEKDECRTQVLCLISDFLEEELMKQISLFFNDNKII